MTAILSVYLFKALNSPGQPGEPHVSTPAAKEGKNEGGGGDDLLLTCTDWRGWAFCSQMEITVLLVIFYLGQLSKAHLF